MLQFTNIESPYCYYLPLGLDAKNLENVFLFLSSSTWINYSALGFCLSSQISEPVSSKISQTPPKTVKPPLEVLYLSGVDQTVPDKRQQKSVGVLKTSWLQMYYFHLYQ